MFTLMMGQFHIISNVSRGVGILSRLKHILPTRVLKSLYQTLILPHFTYCCTIWSAVNKTLFHKLEVLQKRAIRHIVRADYNEHTSRLFLNLKLLKLSDVIAVNLISFVYRALNHQLPSSFDNFFRTNNEIHSHFTRQSYNIHCPPCHSATVLKNPSNTAIDLWNSLPHHIRDCKSLKQLRNSLNKNFFDKY
ncbi:hypothetical protein HOLleu_05786 [Holothuria leucospilota]|uniref:Uncharacterized protein n=1 Tax=Holothuria leucospilota TaxID=206669 RepID=A0A9Q1CLL5_HOLLE|nr:hypothetical protein HOLleu_05786 [Holothuria leucospilota]